MLSLSVAAAARRRPLCNWNVPLSFTLPCRAFATSRQKRTATTKEKKEKQSSGASTIIGKRPGQTPFSPPQKNTQSESNSSKLTASNNTSSSLDKDYMNSSNIKSNTPLIVPPSITPLDDDEPHRDNSHQAHSTPYDKYATKSDNPMKELFLQQGILPQPRPEITKTSNKDTHQQIKLSDLPLPDPSGVSKANPEDILDLSSMYDPAIHLPDKPNFVSAQNRLKYESGTLLTDELIKYIGVRGPITVAEFMRRVLRDGRYGYYTIKGSKSGRKDVDTVDDDDWDLDDDDLPSTNDEVGGEAIIGSGGDFITAPEVSQLFGESLLVWLMTQYQTLGKPSKIQLIEIGPGKGTLICDIVRNAIATFDDFAAALTQSDALDKSKVDVGVHLIEVTNGMRARQKESIESLEKEKGVVEKGYSFHFVSNDDETSENKDEPTNEEKAADNESTTQTKDTKQISIQWHDVLSSVPTHDSDGKPIPTFIICQELVDALPVHSFQKIEGNVWRERLIDCAVREDSEASEAANDVRKAVTRKYTNAETPDKISASSSTSSEVPDKKIPRLRFVLPPDTTPALRTILRVDNYGSPLKDNHAASSLNALPEGSIIEACPEGLILVQDIADRIEKCRGAALIIDYGGDGARGGDTLRGFWKHTQVHPLSRPGEVDVTADVDFGALREAVNRRLSLEESLERKHGNQRRTDTVKEAEVVNDSLPISNLNVMHKMDETQKKFAKPEAFGPISQGQFLASMGIVERVERYIEDDATTDDQAYDLYSALERLVGPDQMGERYKVLAIAAKKDDLFPPPGF